jgi:hypothetical protein
MSGFTTLNNDHLIRSDVWTREIQGLLLDDLCAMQFVNLITDFTDGTTLHIPTIGEAETQDFSEGQAVRYTRMDTGEFTFSFDQYKYSANAISEKFKRDSMWSAEVQSSFVPLQHRALMEAVETRIFERANSGQTASALNVINEANHRWVGSGTNESIALKDFALADFALRKANVPMRDLVAVLDPSVAYTLQTQANLVNFLSPNQRWANVVNDGMITGMKFMFNIYGFDCYVSNYLPRDIAETIDGRSVTVGVANQFFSAAAGHTRPITGGFRQMPKVYSEFNKDLQQTEFLTIAEYGFKLRRPENLVVVLTDTNVVS